MAILKLATAGEQATLAIKNVEVVKGDYGQQVRFDTLTGDTLYVPESSVLRQLDRVGVAEIADMAGMIVHFSRAPNAKKPGAAPFWNLDRARPEDFRDEPKNGNGKSVATQEPDPPKKNPNAQTVPGGVDDKTFADSLVNAGSEIDAELKAKISPDEPTPWDTLVVKYKQCVAAACEAWGENDSSSEALVAAAATLFIARNQKSI